MNDPDAYNLHAGIHASGAEAKAYADKLLLIHLVDDHKMPIEDIAKKYNMTKREMKTTISNIRFELSDEELYGH